MLLNSFDLNFTRLKEAFAAPSAVQDKQHRAGSTHTVHMYHTLHKPAPEQGDAEAGGKQKGRERKPSAAFSVYGILNIKGSTLEQSQPSAAFIAELLLLTSSQGSFPCAFHMEPAH